MISSSPVGVITEKPHTGHVNCLPSVMVIDDTMSPTDIDSYPDGCAGEV